MSVDYQHLAQSWHMVIEAGRKGECGGETQIKVVGNQPRAGLASHLTFVIG